MASSFFTSAVPSSKKLAFSWHTETEKKQSREVCDTFMLKDFGEVQGDRLIPLKAPLNHISDVWSCAHHCIKANHLFSPGLWPTPQPSPTATPL